MQGQGTEVPASFIDLTSKWLYARVNNIVAVKCDLK